MKPWTLSEIEARLSASAGEDRDSDDPKAQRRSRIMDVATAHFVRFGYRRASIGDIARDAGIGKGTIYLHFEGKNALLQACLAREKMQLLPQAAEVLALPPTDRLEAYLKMVLRFVFTAPLSSMLLRGDRELKRLMEELDGERLRVDQQRSVGFIVSLITPIAPEITEEDREKLAKILASVSGLVAHLADPQRRLELPLDVFVDTYAAVLARGVAAMGTQ